MVSALCSPAPDAIRDLAALPWYEVKKIDHFSLSVDMQRSPELWGRDPEYGGEE